MILVAERLIAERGIDAVSLREIGAAAFAARPEFEHGGLLTG